MSFVCEGIKNHFVHINSIIIIIIIIITIMIMIIIIIIIVIINIIIIITADRVYWCLFPGYRGKCR